MADLIGSEERTGDKEEVLDNAYALHITVYREDWLETVKARNKVEVRVVARGQTRDYTFDEFFALLGFSPPAA